MRLHSLLTTTLGSHLRHSRNSPAVQSVQNLRVVLCGITARVQAAQPQVNPSLSPARPDYRGVDEPQHCTDPVWRIWSRTQPLSVHEPPHRHNRPAHTLAIETLQTMIDRQPQSLQLILRPSRQPVATDGNCELGVLGVDLAQAVD
eukprot:12888822-Heterocapsa_arctica.AAC.1